MKFKSDDEIKKALNIDSWKKLSKDKIVKFAAMMPEMDKEVILNRIKQLPEFTKFALDALKTMEKEHETTVKSNKQSQETVHSAYHDVREILKGELNNEDLTFEEKNRLYELIMETADQDFEKDSENKKFLDGLFNKGVIGASTLALIALVFVGGTVLIQGGDK
jgi:beta-galactosidase beta subunit